LVFCSGVLLFFLTRKLTGTYEESIGNATGPPLISSKINNCSYWIGIGNMVIYFLGFSVLFAFFTPLFSYDEPLQYTMIFASLLAMHQRKWILYIIFFTLALIARESTVFLVPGLIFFFLDVDRKSLFPLSAEFKGKLALILLPVVLYAIF